MSDISKDALRDIISDSAKEIKRLLSLESCRAFKDNKERHLDADERVNAREYLAYRFSLRDLKSLSKECSLDAIVLLQHFAFAEVALLHHLVENTNHKENSHPSFKLRLTGAVSAWFNACYGQCSYTKSECAFRVAEFDAELVAAGVFLPVETLEDKESVYERYKELPPAVRTLFFAKNPNENVSLPCSLIKDLLVFFDEDVWKVLCEQANQESKSAFNKHLTAYVDSFIAQEKSQFKLKLGSVAIKKDAEGRILKASNKAQAIAQFCKPRKWIAKQN